MAEKTRKHTREFQQPADDERSKRQRRRQLRLRVSVIVVVVLMVSTSALAIVLPGGSSNRGSSNSSSKTYVQDSQGVSVPVIANYDDLRALARDYEFECDFSHKDFYGQFLCGKVMYDGIPIEISFFGEGYIRFRYFNEPDITGIAMPRSWLSFSLDGTGTALLEGIKNWKYDETEFKQKLKNSTEIMREILTKAVVLYSSVKSDEELLAATKALEDEFNVYIVHDE